MLQGAFLLLAHKEERPRALYVGNARGTTDDSYMLPVCVLPEAMLRLSKNVWCFGD